MMIKLKKKGKVFVEVPIHFRYRGYDEGKKIGMGVGFQSIWYMFWYRFFVFLDKSFRPTRALRSILVALGSVPSLLAISTDSVPFSFSSSNTPSSTPAKIT